MNRYPRLLAALLCLTLLVGCGSRRTAPADPPDTAPEDTASDRQTSQFLCCNGSMTLRFHRGDDGVWLWTDDVSFPLDGQYVDTLVAAAQELNGLIPLANAGKPESYQLVGAKIYLTMQEGDGSAITYYFGAQDEAGSYYVNSSADENRICLAPKRIVELMGRSIYDMALLPELPALKTDQLRSVSIATEARTDHITVSRNSWRLNGEEITDRPEVAGLRTLLASPALIRCVDYAPSDDALSVCALAPPQATLEVVYKGRLGGEETFRLQVGASDGAEGRYVTVGEDPTIYLMSAQPLAVLQDWYGEE